MKWTKNTLDIVIAEVDENAISGPRIIPARAQPNSSVRNWLATFLGLALSRNFQNVYPFSGWEKLFVFQDGATIDLDSDCGQLKIEPVGIRNGRQNLESCLVLAPIYLFTSQVLGR
jgi:hypothetical protein